MPPAAPPYTELLARNLRVARAAVHISQADVAERMQQLGFTYWRRQTTARVELGRRRVTAEELIGLMVVFETDMTALAYPPGDNQFVQLPSGQEVALPAARFGVSAHPNGSVWDGNRSLLTAKQGDDGAP